MKTTAIVSLSLLSAASNVAAFQPESPPNVAQNHKNEVLNRRSVLQNAMTSVFLAGSAATVLPQNALGADLPPFQTSSTGLQWSDAKVGSGQPFAKGQQVACDYTMQTTGARYGTKIYSTANTNNPFRFVVGSDKEGELAIKGLEQAIIGGDGVPPMLPGGVRRVIIPSSLGYESLAKPIPGMQFQDCQEGKGPGPIPPVPEAFEEYQRFKNIYWYVVALQCMYVLCPFFHQLFSFFT